MPYRWRDILKEPPTPEELDKVLGGRPIVEITGRLSPLRKRLAEGLDKPSRKEAVALLSKHPNWIRRPLIIAGNRVVIGFNEAEIRSLVSERAER